MTRSIVIVVSLSTLILTGCGTTKKSKSHKPIENEVYGDVSINEKVQPDWSEQARKRPKGQLSPFRPVAARPVLIFTEKECAHVRLPGIHVLPEGGLAIDLNLMNDEFCYPYYGKLISDYGMRGRSMHTGVDIKAQPNDTIRAALPGVVRMSKEYSGYGNVVVIRHYNGLETLYSHAARNLVKVNDAVESGDPIALAGRTGRATTEHLHFEVRVGGEPIDPKNIIDPNTMKLRTRMLYARQVGGHIVAYNGDQERGDMELQPVAATDNPPTYKAAATANPSAGVDKTVYHTVKSGETLSQIARRYSTSVNKICQLNNLSNPDRLRLNQRLRVK